MAQFYGTVQGSRGETSRLGDKGSGLTARLMSWEGMVCVYLSYNTEQGCDWIVVTFGPHSSDGPASARVELYNGPASGWKRATLVGTLGRMLVEHEKRELTYSQNL